MGSLKQVVERCAPVCWERTRKGGTEQWTKICDHVPVGTAVQVRIVPEVEDVGWDEWMDEYRHIEMERTGRPVPSLSL